MTQPSEISLLRRAYATIEKMETRIKALEAKVPEAVAVIGMACRFPGQADMPRIYWKNLCAGHDAITEVPRERWDIDQYFDPNPEIPGKMSTRWGAFIQQMDTFDAAFFNITPREARSMDPQQRLLMEVAWEALEDAGHASLTALRASATGVFVGISTDDYAQLQMAQNGPAGIDTYFASGTARSVASGRLAYVFGLQGPALSIDTACSSSLVAVHQALLSLQQGECRMAIAAGVNLILSPLNSITLSKYQMMAPDGRSKTFDADANGFVRGEGCGAVVLKRLADALKDGDQIHVVIRGSAINQDGASSGLTAPNGSSQKAVIREALRKAGIQPGQIRYVEAHGTGTALGDPIEMRALGECYGLDRPQGEPLIVGSAKPNIGHLEAASGIAGLIKTILVLKHGQIPQNIYFNTPNPNIPWERFALKVPTTTMPFPAEKGRRYAAVTGLGFSGTNVHMILSDYLAETVADTAKPPPWHLIPLSADTPQAIRRLTQNLVDWLDETPDTALGSLVRTLGAGRSHRKMRHTVLADSMPALRQSLSAFLQTDAVKIRSNNAVERGEPPKTAFLFTGQGSQYPGMGRELDRYHSEFRKTIDQCDAILHPMLNRSIRGILFPEKTTATELIHETQFAQPALFVLEYALARLWQSWGIRPAFLLGHSLGEYVAACIAGVFSLEDALKIVVNRARLMQLMKPDGAMHTILASEDAVVAAVAGYADTVAIAAFNGPEHVVISGEREAVEEISASFSCQGHITVALKVSHAFHSPLIHPMLDAFEASLADIHFNQPRIRLISNLSGAISGVDDFTTPGYWRKHAENTVRFKTGVETIYAQGCRLFVEIGPQPILTGMARHCLPTADQKWLPSLHHQRNDWQCIFETLGELYLEGMDIDWEKLSEPFAFQRISLPPYPFEQRRFWFTETPRNPIDILPVQLKNQIHPLALAREDSATGRIVFRAILPPERTAVFRDHRVSGSASLPIAAVLEASFQIARGLAEAGDTVCVRDLTMDHMIELPNTASLVFEWTIDPDGDGHSVFKLFSKREDDKEWRHNATGRFSAEGLAVMRMDAKLLAATKPAEIQARCDSTISADLFYAVFERSGLDFGPTFHLLEKLWVGHGEALGKLKTTEPAAMKELGFRFSPLLIDGALQVIAGTYMNRKDVPGRIPIYLPVGIDRFEIFSDSAEEMWGHAVLHPGQTPGSRTLVSDVTLLNKNGECIAAIRGCRLLHVNLDTLTDAGHALQRELLYRIQWESAGTDLAEETTGSPRSLQALEEITAALRPILPDIARRYDLENYEKHVLDMNRLVSLYIRMAFKKLGWQAVPGDYIESATLSAQMEIQGYRRELFNHYFKILAEDGILSPSGDGWLVEKHLNILDANAMGRQIVDSGAPTSIEVELINRCGCRLAEALRGTANPLDLLFDSEAFPMVTQLYRESVTARLYNNLVKEFIVRLMSRMSGGRPLRILEIGAGTGGTTLSVMEGLEGLEYTYTSTDISPAFVNAANRRFAQHAGFRAQVLDIEKQPGPQGLADTQFDLIVAANVIHATSDLETTLTHLYQLTKPGGTVLLLEVTTPQRWIDITFGLTEGWWKFTDRKRRRQYPLITAQDWRQVLEETGFKDSTAIPSAGEYPAGSVLAGESLIAARRPMQVDSEQDCYILGNDFTPGQVLSEYLTSEGFNTILVEQDHPAEEYQRPRLQSPSVLSGMDALLSRITTISTTARTLHAPRIVYMWGMAEPGRFQGDIADPLTLQQYYTYPLLRLFQALAMADMSKPPQITVVTRAAQADADDQSIDPHAAAIWGLVRAVMLEHPEFNCKLVDLQAEPQTTDAGNIYREIQRNDHENQVLIRNGQRRVARLLHMDLERSVPDTPLLQRLETKGRGLLDTLYWKPVQPQVLGPNQIRIRVQASGLNFRDVLNALGVYADGPVPFGGECAGLIVEIGADVSTLALGDRVIAIAPHSLATEVVVDAQFTCAIPADIDFVDAAGLPIAYTTAWYALVELAQLQPGQSILIHAAAGGVGLAAVRIAQKIGAIIYATAGNQEKRDFLSRLGIQHIMSSRSTAFADQIAESTDGKGVDVVLNSLSGDFIERSFFCTASHGIFLELGRTDIASPESVSKKRPDVTYHPINLTEAMTSAPETIQPILKAVIDQIEQKTLPLLPCRQFHHHAVIDAFRFMAAARQIGKIIITLPWEADTDEIPIFPEGTYWITGGLGGLGLETAKWLAKKGAGHILLSGRHGPDVRTEAWLTALCQSGVQITTVISDVASSDEIEKVLAGIAEKHPPLRGVIHAAGALDDGVLRHQNRKRFEHVYKAKVAGAWHLHQATRHMNLDFFVLYSSAASILGSPGQTNHCAANAFMDALAHYRRLSGLKALSINWGAWANVGAAVKEAVAARATLQGLDPLSPETGITFLEKLIRSRNSQSAVMAVNWRQYTAKVYPHGTAPPIISQLVRSATTAKAAAPIPKTSQAERKNLRQSLAACPESQRREMLIDYLQSETLRILGLDAGDIIDPDKPLMDLGLDSLMAVEMRNALSSAIGQNLSATLLFDYPTLESVGNFLLALIGLLPNTQEALLESDTGTDENQPSTDDLLRWIETMPDDEIDRRMNEKD